MQIFLWWNQVQTPMSWGIFIVCARLAQLVRSLTTNQEAPGVQYLAWLRVELSMTFHHTDREQGR